MRAMKVVAVSLCTAISTGAAPHVMAAGCAVDVTTIKDTVYSPIRNDVVTRIPPLPANQPELDTLKLQIQNGISGGIANGSITEEEALQLYEMLDAVGITEAQFKTGCGLTEEHINNLMRRYHMISNALNDMYTNSRTNDFMPRFEQRRESLMRRILYHMAATNLTPAEGEQLLGSLNDISNQYATARATGGTLTADELEGLHKDLFMLQKKLREKTSGFIARVVPATVPEREEFLAKIRGGLAGGQLTAAEGACLIKEYNNFVVLEATLVAHEGPRSPAIQNLAQTINNRTFILDRQMRDRANAESAAVGSSNRM